MNRKAISTLWAVAIQLVLAAFIVLTVYQTVGQYVDGESYELDLHSVERALLVESMSAKNTGVIQLHTFSPKDYSTSISESSLEVKPPGDISGKIDQIHLPVGFTINEDEIVGRGARWTRTASTLTMDELSTQRECPWADINWEKVAAVGERPYVTYVEIALESAYENVSVYERLSLRQEVDFFVRIDLQQREEAVIYTGVGHANDRTRCLAASKLESNGIDVVVESSRSQEDQLHLLLPYDTDLLAVRKSLVELFEEVHE